MSQKAMHLFLLRTLDFTARLSQTTLDGSTAGCTSYWSPNSLNPAPPSCHIGVPKKVRVVSICSKHLSYPSYELNITKAPTGVVYLSPDLSILSSNAVSISGTFLFFSPKMAAPLDVNPLIISPLSYAKYIAAISIGSFSYPAKAHGKSLSCLDSSCLT